MSTILTWGAIGLGAWWIYETYFAGAAAAAASSGTTPSGSTTGTTSSTSASGGTPVSGGGSPAPPSVTIAQLYAGLLAAVKAAVASGDTSIIPPGAGLSGLGAVGRTGGIAAPVSGGVLATYSGPASHQIAPGAVSQTVVATDYTATPDVFNYYLQQAFPNPPATSPDGWPPNGAVLFVNQSVPITLGNYWAAVSSYLSSQMGLSGLGIFAGLGMIASAGRQWPEIATQPWNGGDWPLGGQGWWQGGGRAIQ